MTVSLHHSVVRCAALCVAAIAALVADAGAQVVTGALTAEGTGAPIRGVVISVLYVGGAPTGRRVLSDERGNYTVRAPGPGTFVLEFRAIGYVPQRSEMIALGAGETKSAGATLRQVTTRLTGLRVESRSECRRATQLDAVAHEVWDDVWAALASSEIAREQHLLKTDVFVYARELDPRSGLVRAEQRRTVPIEDERPFRTAPARELQAEGFWRPTLGGEINFYAPDAQVLMSPEFLGAHCFALVQDVSTGEARVGLSFRPVRNQAPREVEGVLWIDPTSRQLRTMEFRYTGIPALRGLRPEGRMTFAPLPSGTWVDEQWLIRQPFERPAPPGTPGGNEVLLREGGGFMLTDSAKVSRFVGITGSIRGATGAESLTDASVEVLGTELRVAVNADGTFGIGDILPGTYVVRVQRNGAAEQGGFVLQGAFALSAGEVGNVSLTVPDAAEIAGNLCPNARPEARTISVYGVLRNSATGRPAVGYPIELTWALSPSADPAAAAIRRSDIRRFISDWRGAFVVCDVPAGAPLRIRNAATGAGGWSEPLPVGQRFLVTEILLDTLAAEAARRELLADAQRAVRRRAPNDSTAAAAPRPAVGPRVLPVQGRRRPPVRS